MLQLHLAEPVHLGLDLAGVGHQSHDNQLTVMLSRQERHRRGGHDVGDGREFLGRGFCLGDERRDRIRAFTQDGFFERTRRYSFLVMLGLVVWLGYLSATGALAMSVPPCPHTPR